MLNILDITARNCNQYDLACNKIFVLGDGINSDFLIVTAFLKEIKSFKLINNCSCLVLITLRNMSQMMLIIRFTFQVLTSNFGLT